MNEEKARAYVAGLQLQEDAEGKLLAIKRDRERARAEAKQEPHDGERVLAWFGRYVTRREREIVSTRDIEDHWRKWIGPHLNDKPIAGLRRADVEACTRRGNRGRQAAPQDGAERMGHAHPRHEGCRIVEGPDATRLRRVAVHERAAAHVPERTEVDRHPRVIVADGSPSQGSTWVLSSVG
jgi:hypothetical protein